MNPVSQILETHRMNRRELARVSHVGYSTVCSLDKGVPKEMSKSTATKLSRFAGVPPYQLMQLYDEWKSTLS